MLKQTKVAIDIHTRLSYANIWKLKSINGGKEIYSVSLIIPNSYQKIISVIDNAIQENIGKLVGLLVPNEFENQLFQKLREANVLRTISYVIQTNSGKNKMSVFTSKETATWLDKKTVFGLKAANIILASLTTSNMVTNLWS